MNDLPRTLATTARAVPEAASFWLPGADAQGLPGLAADALADTLGQALIVFDETGAVSWASRSALWLIAGARLVHLDRRPPGPRRLVCLAREPAERLQFALRVRVGDDVGILIDPESRLLLNLRPAGDTARVGRLLCLAERPAPVPSAGWLAEAFGLTAAETRVLDALASFDRGRDAASHLGISQHTLKDHLASIYAKTGCNRKAQLFRLLGLASACSAWHMDESTVVAIDSRACPSMSSPPPPRASSPIRPPIR
ncbi:helix-turn-helix transcriptional regulator [Burkholderiaceae bacterium FT117]|uniref:helix-turn-helix transcriptional regulator n=1 Tax=Zeimonas sediminis TaxID=2944268 RepID=UPI00234311F1|nr:helix-turn-helix transcriptional regulator [Zeimonas sediminis]MCM5571425.1 helix-turn-helix transcriptional regulator [Zeimonas sediminis]